MFALKVMLQRLCKKSFCLKEERKEYQESELLCPQEIVFNHSNRLTNIIASPLILNFSLEVDHHYNVSNTTKVLHNKLFLHLDKGIEFHFSTSS